MTRGERLREARGNLPRKLVAEACGISRSALEMYENDCRNPKDNVKIAIANYYGLTVQELFY